MILDTDLTLAKPGCGDPVLLKQSRFVACGAPVAPGAEPAPVVQLLASRFRMTKASHLSWACRLSGGVEHKSDGGESGAGNCILEVLCSMNAVDCVVLVARWYGGKHLGGARFRIYRDAARALLAIHGVPVPEGGGHGAVQ